MANLIDEPRLTSPRCRLLGKIAGAALDVTVKEPLASRKPALETGKLLYHAARERRDGKSIWDREEELISENLKRWFSGSELLEPRRSLPGLLSRTPSVRAKNLSFIRTRNLNKLIHGRSRDGHVSLARMNDGFLLFASFVVHGEWIALIVNRIDFQLVEFSRPERLWE